MAKFLLLSEYGQYYNKVVEEEDLYDALNYHWSNDLYGAIRIDEDEGEFETQKKG